MEALEEYVGMVNKAKKIKHDFIVKCQKVLTQFLNKKILLVDGRFTTASGLNQIINKEMIPELIDTPQNINMWRTLSSNWLAWNISVSGTTNLHLNHQTVAYVGKIDTCILHELEPVEPLKQYTHDEVVKLKNQYIEQNKKLKEIKNSLQDFSRFFFDF